MKDFEILFTNDELKRAKNASNILKYDPFCIPRSSDNVTAYRPTFNALAILEAEEELLPNQFKLDPLEEALLQDSHNLHDTSSYSILNPVLSSPNNSSTNSSPTISRYQQRNTLPIPSTLHHGRHTSHQQQHYHNAYQPIHHPLQQQDHLPQMYRHQFQCDSYNQDQSNTAPKSTLSAMYQPSTSHQDLPFWTSSSQRNEPQSGVQYELYNSRAPSPQENANILSLKQKQLHSNGTSTTGGVGRSSKTCRVDGCTKGARGKVGLCQRHGGGKRCKVPDCTKGAQGSSSMCLFHGGGYRCTVEGCTTGARGTSGLCARHGGYNRLPENRPHRSGGSKNTSPSSGNGAVHASSSSPNQTAAVNSLAGSNSNRIDYNPQNITMTTTSILESHAAPSYNNADVVDRKNCPKPMNGHLS